MIGYLEQSMVITVEACFYGTFESLLNPHQNKNAITPVYIKCTTTY